METNEEEEGSYSQQIDKSILQTMMMLAMYGSHGNSNNSSSNETKMTMQRNRLFKQLVIQCEQT